MVVTGTPPAKGGINSEFIEGKRIVAPKKPAVTILTTIAEAIITPSPTLSNQNDEINATTKAHRQPLKKPIIISLKTTDFEFGTYLTILKPRITIVSV